MVRGVHALQSDLLGDTTLPQSTPARTRPISGPTGRLGDARFASTPLPAIARIRDRNKQPGWTRRLCLLADSSLKPGHTLDVREGYAWPIEQFNALLTNDG